MGKHTVQVRDHLVIPARVSLTSGQERLNRLIGRTVPDHVAIRLVIDTGSRRSFLIPGILRYLNPTRIGDARVETSSGIADTSLYWVRLEFPDTALSPIPHVAIARLPLPPLLATYHGL